MTCRRTVDRRKSELARIHILKNELHLSDDEYRDMLFTLTQHRSAADIGQSGRSLVLEHLKGLLVARSKRKNYPGRPHNCDDSPQLLKVEALLTDARRPWSYADAIAKRMYHKDRVAFCNSRELNGIIAALSKDKQRHTA